MSTSIESQMRDHARWLDRTAPEIAHPETVDLVRPKSLATSLSGPLVMLASAAAVLAIAVGGWLFAGGTPSEGSLVAEEARRALAEEVRFDRHPLVGTAFDDFTLQSTDGTTGTGDLERPLIVALWSPWCVPCQDHLTQVESAAPADTTLLAVAVLYEDDDENDDVEEIQAWLSDAAIELPTAWDARGELWQDLEPMGLPVLVIVDANNTIVGYVEGHIGEELMAKTFDVLLGSGFDHSG